MSERHAPWAPGISVIVHSPVSVDCLAACMHSLHAALASLSEPSEIIAGIIDHASSERHALTERYPHVRCLPVTSASSAADLSLLIRAAKYDGVYMLDSALRLADDALVHLLPYRGPNVFAIASQIVGDRYPKQTGWTDVRMRDGDFEFFDAPPDDDGFVRAHLYAKPHASLFRRQLLGTFLSDRDHESSFSFEAVQWGVGAWQASYEVLFCPASRARLDSSEAAKLSSLDLKPEQGRRLAQLLWPRPTSELDLEALCRTASDLDLQVGFNYGQLVLARNAFSAAAAKSNGAVRTEVNLSSLRRKYYPRSYADGAGKPYLLIVSPYAIYPPTHGGAVRIAELLRALTTEFRVVLLSDESALYTADSLHYFRDAHAVHLVAARPREMPINAPDRIRRILNHCHPSLRTELKRLIECYEPAIVQIEFVELAAMVIARSGPALWVIDLHDVLFSSTGQSEEDRFEASLVQQYDATIVCSKEDAALVHGAPVTIVPNAARAPQGVYVSSAGNSSILFAGPFRYSPNLKGIQEFLALVYPALKNEIPELEIMILGGVGARDIAASDPRFAQAGVSVHEQVENVHPYLQQCALTINPLHDIRGSSIKLIESLAAGRVCVSTKEGARGFATSGYASLITVNAITEFRKPLQKLLLNERYRVGLERPSPSFLEAISWKMSAKILSDAYRHVMRPGELVAR